MLVTAAVNLIPVTESQVARVVPSLPLSSLLGRGDCYLLHKWCGNDSSSCVHIAVPKYNLRSCCPLCQISFWMKTNDFLYKAFYWWYYNIFQKQFIDGSRFRWRWLLQNIRGNIFSPANNWGYCLNITKKKDFWISSNIFSVARDILMTQIFLLTAIGLLLKATPSLECSNSCLGWEKH